MKNKKIKLLGKDGFNSFYTEVFKERWENLKENFTQDTIHAEICFKGCESYFLDPASIVSALCLPIKKAERVLDMCAAPGGKTLVLAGNLADDAIQFSNERSPQRKARLVKVVQNSLPLEISERIKTSCSDSSSWCRREKENYDSILLDAPCSSERHVFNDSKYLNEWTTSRIKTISMEQWALLSCAFRLIKNEGYILYSTCALAPQENDEIIRKLKKKFDNAIIVPKEELKDIFKENLAEYKGKISVPKNYDLFDMFSKAEETEFGFHILPDYANGAGPIFFCLIKKIDVV